jgi:hypothetical protein
VDTSSARGNVGTLNGMDPIILDPTIIDPDD